MEPIIKSIRQVLLDWWSNRFDEPARRRAQAAVLTCPEVPDLDVVPAGAIVHILRVPVPDASPRSLGPSAVGLARWLLLGLAGLVAGYVGARHALLLITVATVVSVSVSVVRVVARPGREPDRPTPVATVVASSALPVQPARPASFESMCPGPVLSEKVAAC